MHLSSAATAEGHKTDGGSGFQSYTLSLMHSKPLHLSVIGAEQGDGRVGSEQTLKNTGMLSPPIWHDTGIVTMPRRGK